MKRVIVDGKEGLLLHVGTSEIGNMYGAVIDSDGTITQHKLTNLIVLGEEKVKQPKLKDIKTIEADREVFTATVNSLLEKGYDPMTDVDRKWWNGKFIWTVTMGLSDEH